MNVFKYHPLILRLSILALELSHSVDFLNRPAEEYLDFTKHVLCVHKNIRVYEIFITPRTYYCRRYVRLLRTRMYTTQPCIIMHIDTIFIYKCNEKK